MMKAAFSTQQSAFSRSGMVTVFAVFSMPVVDLQ
jgi:hypothetical protein